MVTPTITYGHGFLDDFKNITDNAWTLQLAPPSTAAATCDEGDYFAGAITVYGGDTYWINNTATLDLAAATYTKIRVRYKCSNANVKAKIVLSFVGGSQTVFGPTNSTTLTTVTATLSTGLGLLNYILIYTCEAVGTVYYDFIHIYKNDFPIPTNPLTGEWILPERISEMDIPGKGGDETQNLGTKNAVFHLNFDLTLGTWTRSGGSDKLSAEVFLDIWHNSGSEPWQWFKSGLGAYKVTLHNLRFPRSGEAWMLACELHEKRVSSAYCSHETYDSRFQLDTVGT